MFKRVVWLGVGYAAGISTSYWAYRKVQRTVQRYVPAELAGRAKHSATELGQSVRGALSDGREAMRDREVELETVLERRRN